MNTKSIVAIAIAIAVGAITLSTVLVPAISMGTNTEDTFKNVGSFDMTYSQTENVTLMWDHTAPGKITVNDVAITMPTLANGESRTVLCGDDWLIRFGYGTSLGGNYIQWYASSGSNIIGSVNNGYDFTATCTNGTVTITDTASTPNTATGSYTYLYCVANDGDYIMKNANESAYMVGDSPIYAMGLTNVGTFTSTGIKIEGTIDDGVTWSIFRGGDGYTFTNEEINYEPVSGYKGLYKLSSMTATVTKETQSVDATYSFFIVPEEVTAEKTIHANAPTIALFNIIPVFVALGLILAVVGIAYVKYRR